MAQFTFLVYKANFSYSFYLFDVNCAFLTVTDYAIAPYIMLFV